MAKDDDDEAGPSLAAIRARLKKWPWGGSKSKEEDDSSASSSPNKSPGGLYVAPPWLPLPKIVMAAFGLNLLFLMIGLIVASLVLGGTISITAKAIGLTQSLVLISSIFSLAYMVVHMLAARRPDPVEGLTSKKRTSRHTRIIMLGRITTGLWAVSLLAVAITLASLPADSQTSRSPLQAGLAACIMDCLDMTVVLLVVERTTQPFVLPWLTPPVPEAQTLAAKALIDGILGDGVSGHPYAGSEAPTTATEADAMAIAADSRSSSDGEEPVIIPKRKMRVTIQEVPDGQDEDPTVSTSTLAPPPSLGGEMFGQPSAATLVERQEIWNRVDEGNSAKASSIKLPPHPSTFFPSQQHQIQPVPPIPPQHMYGIPPGATFMQPMPSPFQYYPPQPTFLPPMHMQTAPYPPTPPAAPPAAVPARPPLSRAAGSGLPRYNYTPALSTVPSTVPSPVPTMNAGGGGPRPMMYDAGRMQSYATYVGSMGGGSSNSARSDGAQSVPPITGPMGARPPPPPPVKGKRLFDKAVQGLKANEKRNEPVWDDYSTIHVPGSFVDM
ncbi:hypothetical protein SBRCBS47491_005840 [Sporothrix bragantina]|uniref:Uncharacterized protein n=1 Tax=Sporothrix bragantina TaxID=671064 RepID=A0ABP0C108_9PEZI